MLGGQFLFVQNDQAVGIGIVLCRSGESPGRGVANRCISEAQKLKSTAGSPTVGSPERKDWRLCP
jgi:hypothetical protein